MKQRALSYGPGNMAWDQGDRPFKMPGLHPAILSVILNRGSRPINTHRLCVMEYPTGM